MRHGTLHFSTAANRLYATELFLGAAALMIPFLATRPGRARLRPRRGALGRSCRSSCCAFRDLGADLAAAQEAGPGSIRAVEASCSRGAERPGAGLGRPSGPIRLSDRPWCCSLARRRRRLRGRLVRRGLEPAMAAIGMSEAFAGLIVVAVAEQCDRASRRRDRGLEEPRRPGDEPDPELDPPGRALPGAGDRAPELRRGAGAAHADLRPAAARAPSR